METKYIKVARVTMETPYGDRFSATDRYLNIHGDLVVMWVTDKGNVLADSPKKLVKKGYKVVDRSNIIKSYKFDGGVWSCQGEAKHFYAGYQITHFHFGQPYTCEVVKSDEATTTLRWLDRPDGMPETIELATDYLLGNTPRS